MAVVPLAGAVGPKVRATTLVPGWSSAGLGAAAVAVAVLAVARALVGRTVPAWRWLALTAIAGAVGAVTTPAGGGNRPDWRHAALGVVVLAGLLGANGAVRRPSTRRRRSWAADAMCLGGVGALTAAVAPGAGRHAGALGAAALAGAGVAVALQALGGLRRKGDGTGRAGPLLLAVAAGAGAAGHVVAAVRDDTGSAAWRAAAAVALLAVVVLPGRSLVADVGRRGDRADGLLGRIGVPVTALVAVVVLLAWRADRSTGAPRTTVALLAVTLAALAAERLVRVVVRADRARHALRAFAGLDPLTGLPGREQVEERLLAALDGPERPVAVLLVDVDRFQHVNDTRGHRHGDAVLRELADRLVRIAPTDAVVGRTGGDEFTVAAVDLRSEEEVLRLADRLLTVFDRPLRVADEDLFLTGTVGIATDLGRPGAGVHDLFREADTALHRAKAGARGGATVFDAGMRVAVERRVDTEMQLRGAIDRGELAMHYQPVVDISSGVVTGFEALMRWAHPSGRLVGPGAFIAVAEETGLVVPMGAWAIVESLHQLRRWIDDGVCARNVGMAVNLAARQLHDAGLIATVMGALHGAALPPHQLTLEVTETALLSDATDVERTIDRLKALGVQIALDDFGTGYSSLAHLRRFPIDRIKVDRSFVGNLESSAEDRALVRSIVVMARELGKDVVAEGVETRGQLEVLARIGCAKAQGYLFSEPLPAHAVGRRALTLEPPRRPDAAAG